MKSLPAGAVEFSVGEDDVNISAGRSQFSLRQLQPRRLPRAGRSGGRGGHGGVGGLRRCLAPGGAGGEHRRGTRRDHRRADRRRAARWFERAAKNGTIAGEVEYAILQFNGEGVPANEAAAARMFRRAALKGNAIAQNRLARLYAAGRGVPANKIEAAAWQLMAAAKGLSDPWLDDALKDMPAEDRTRAEQIAGERMGRQMRRMANGERLGLALGNAGLASGQPYYAAYAPPRNRHSPLAIRHSPLTPRQAPA